MVPAAYARRSGWLSPRQPCFPQAAHPPQNVQRFLEAQRARDPEDLSALQAVALITQLLVIDSHGNPQPTKLTSEAQIRLFVPGGGIGTVAERCGQLPR